MYTQTSQHRLSDTGSTSSSVPSTMNEILERAGRESCESITKWMAEQQQSNMPYETDFFSDTKEDYSNSLIKVV